MTTFNLPDLGEGLAEAEIVRWHVAVGDQVKVDQPMVALETAKAVVEVPSPYSGIVQALHGKPGDVIATGAPLVDFQVEAGARPAQPVQKPAPDARKSDAPRRNGDSGTVVGNMPTSDEELVEEAVAGRSAGDAAAGRERVRAAPAVRALAKRLGVELADVRGSGRGGLITVDDVMSVSARGSAATFARPAATPAATATGEPEKLRGLRRAMSQSMAAARDSVMNCTLF